MEQRALDDLLTRWASGELSADEFAALERILASDAGARRRLRQHAMLDEALRELPEVAGQPPGGFPRVEWPRWLSWGGSGVPWLLVLGMMICVGAAAWWLGTQGSHIEATKLMAGAATAHDALQFPIVKSLKIDSHAAKLSLDRIGTVTVDGPADFRLVGPMRARLNRGRIKVRITEESGHGFVVETPDGEVTDLGTEFGLDVVDGKQSGVVVFRGSVDLRIAQNRSPNMTPAERLVCGEGVTFARGGPTVRIPCLTTGHNTTFLFSGNKRPRNLHPVIVDVSDNLSSSETKRFYEIVPGGLREDALAYVDRPEHQWNGVTREGILKYLIGADYVKTFSGDKERKDREIRVTLSRPAELYVFFDTDLKPPDWLRTGFRKTNKTIGMDLGPWPEIKRPVQAAKGPGNSIDHVFTIWERTVKSPGVVTLGPNGAHKASKPFPYMYGIAAVALDSTKNKKTEKQPQKK
jgi:ferric-dicitrate binding protein FerR (iron transport regulator)